MSADAIIDHDGVRIHFEQTGTGVPVLFVPGSYSTPAAWRGVQKNLHGNYRFFGTSLNGYGHTSETRTSHDCGIEHGVRIIEAVAAQIAEPFHLVGHSFGGYLALKTALAGNVKPLSLALFEANPIPVVKASRMDLYQSAEVMTADFATAIAQGDPDAAALIIDFWGGQGAFAEMPAVVQNYCRACTSSNLLDWHGAMSARVNPRDCAKIDCNVLLVRGGEANELMVAMTDLLGAHLTQVRTNIVAGAGHFLISSHPVECGSLLSGFYRSLEDLAISPSAPSM
ncbi:MAG: pimeloyl-ACP methyl ester carboxylesterase [Gammaproteobacteria bacterium]|jgi:pimeloyl-ACP methyl ester carboxylesterase